MSGWTTAFTSVDRSVASEESVVPTFHQAGGGLTYRQRSHHFGVEFAFIHEVSRAVGRLEESTTTAGVPASGCTGGK